MKMKKFILIWLLLAMVTSISAQQTDFPKFTGPYLGQKPPGTTPEIFAPGIVSSTEYIDFKLTFSPDGTECFFYRLSDPSDELIPTIFFTKIEKGAWTKPAQWPESQGARAFHPCVTLDNKWLLFYWNFGQDPIRQTGFYMSARTDTGWSVPKYAGQGMYLTCDNSGRFYTTQSVWGDQPKHYLAEVTVSNGLFTKYERVKINPHYENQTHPCIAPDGSYILFDINVENGSLFVSFKDKDGKWDEGIDLTRHGFKPDCRGAYISPDGKYLFFSYNRDIWWVAIQAIENLRPKQAAIVSPAATLPPNQLLRQITKNPANDLHAKWSPDGKILAFNSWRSGELKIWLTPADGGDATLLETGLSGDHHVSWAPDRKQIAFDATKEGRPNLFTISLDRGELKRLSKEGTVDFLPCWSPDGSHIAFTSLRSGNQDIWIISSEGDQQLQLTNDDASDRWPVWSPDGSKIAFTSNRSGNFDIWIVPAAGGELKQLTFSDSHDDQPCWSPDGTRIAFMSNRSGNYDIWILSVSGGEPIRFTEGSNNSRPSWSPDGKKIAFTSDRTGNSDIWVKDVKEGFPVSKKTTDKLQPK